MLPSAALPPTHRGGPEHLPGAHTRAGNAMNRTRAGLLSGAARAFAEHGLRRSTMQSIAVAAGVAKATLYNHFRTKDEVAAALLAVELDRLSTYAASLPRDQALASLDRLARIDARLVLPGHGTPWDDGVEAAVDSARRIGCR